MKKFFVHCQYTRAWEFDVEVDAENDEQAMHVVQEKIVSGEIELPKDIYENVNYCDSLEVYVEDCED